MEFESGVKREDFEGFHRWTYKDSNRCLWTLEIWKSGEALVPYLSEPGDPVYDLEWAYEMYRDKDSIYHGTLRGQYEIVPWPEEFFLDYLQYVNNVVVGVGKYAVPDPSN